MSHPINDNDVIHEGQKARCPYCHRTLHKKKFHNLKTGESFWAWMHVIHEGTPAQAYYIKCDLNESYIRDEEVLDLAHFEDFHHIDTEGREN